MDSHLTINRKGLVYSIRARLPRKLGTPRHDMAWPGTAWALAEVLAVVGLCAGIAVVPIAAGFDADAPFCRLRPSPYQDARRWQVYVMASRSQEAARCRAEK